MALSSQSKSKRDRSDPRVAELSTPKKKYMLEKYVEHIWVTVKIGIKFIPRLFRTCLELA